MDKVKLGVIDKRYPHRFNIDVNTTHNFGFTQPIFCRAYEKGDSVNVTFNELLRLAPLPTPTFARIRLENSARFVPMNEIYPPYQNFLSELPYNNGSLSFVPSHLPTVTNQFLVELLLSKFSRYASYVYHSNPGGSGVDGRLEAQPVNHTSSNLKQDLETFYGTNNLFNILDYFNSADSHYDSDINPDSCDFAIFNYFSGSTYVHFFKLNNDGRNLRKILIGLGYNLNISNTEQLCSLPIIAFYKAYYDKYFPTRDTNFQDTHCFKIIKKFENNDTVTVFNSSSSKADKTLFSDFADELIDCYATADNDFLSAHMLDPVNGIEKTIGYVAADNNQSVGSYTENDNKVPVIQEELLSSVSAITIKALQRLNAFVGKDSVIGKKLSSWLDAHGSGDVINSIEKDAYNVHNFSLDAMINDVFSTSDTASTSTGEGEFLGAYAGKGIGMDKSSFNFDIPEDGYLIVFQNIIPTSGYFQGCNPQLYAIDRDSVFYPEYDGLGYEVNPQSMFFGDNGVLKDRKSAMQTSFGFIPRYSSLKAIHNVVNGDMSLRSKMDSFVSYFLDRVFTFNEVLFLPKYGDSSAGWDVLDSNEREPAASVQFRYLGRDSAFGNYDRIFYNSGFVSKGGTPTRKEMDIDDNFICQVNMFITETTKKLPMSMSYDTVIDEVNSKVIEKNLE